MGFNSVVFICNDAIHAIEADPKGWWEKTWEALSRIGFDEDTSYGHRHCLNGFQAVWNKHADYTGVIMVGGNMATVIGGSLTKNHHEEDGQNKILIEMLEQRGYKVTKAASKTA